MRKLSSQLGVPVSKSPQNNFSKTFEAWMVNEKEEPHVKFQKMSIPKFPKDDFKLPKDEVSRIHFLITNLVNIFKKGGYLCQDVYIPKEVCFQTDLKVPVNSLKSKFCENITNLIKTLQKVDVANENLFIFGLEKFSRMCESEYEFLKKSTVQQSDFFGNLSKSFFGAFSSAPVKKEEEDEKLYFINALITLENMFLLYDYYIIHQQKNKKNDIVSNDSGRFTTFY
eukprot:gene6218-10224_t